VTEHQWRACRDPKGMFQSLGRRVSPRKIRLFAVACTRRVLHLLPDDKYRRALDSAEQFADGLAKRGEVKSWWKCLGHRSAGHAEMSVIFVLLACLEKNKELKEYDPEWAVTAVEMAASTHWFAFWSRWRVRAEERAVQAALLRDILGNPFNLVTLDPTWRTTSAVQLARSLYEERRFEDMPVLADALEEAGCKDAAVLGHCRGQGPHARGCWALDLLLGKE